MPKRSSSSIRKQLVAVRRSLRGLDRSLSRLAAALNGFGGAPSSVARARRQLSSRARAALKLQGRYMGYMRQLKPKQKAAVRAVKEKKGVEAAIKNAQILAGKGKAG